MFRIVDDIDYGYLKDIENKIVEGNSLSEEDVSYFLRCVVYITRMKIFDGDYYLENKCDLAQSIICNYFNQIGVCNYPNSTLKAISNYVCGHSFIVATFVVDDNDVNYLIDPTYIQFFKEDNCDVSNYKMVNGFIVKTPHAGYFIKDGDRKIINDFNYDGFGILSSELARIYGDSFYNTRTMVMDISYKSLGGNVYINSFLKGNERLSKSMEELIRDNKNIDFNGSIYKIK